MSHLLAATFKGHYQESACLLRKGRRAGQAMLSDKATNWLRAAGRLRAARLPRSTHILEFVWRSCETNESLSMYLRTFCVSFHFSLPDRYGFITSFLGPLYRSMTLALYSLAALPGLEIS